MHVVKRPVIIPDPKKRLKRIMSSISQRKICGGSSMYRAMCVMTLYYFPKKSLTGRKGQDGETESDPFHGKTQGKKNLILFSRNALTSTLEGAAIFEQ